MKGIEALARQTNSENIDGVWIVLESEPKQRLLGSNVAERKIIDHHHPAPLIEEFVQELPHRCPGISSAAFSVHDFDVECGCHAVRIQMAVADLANRAALLIDDQPVAIRWIAWINLAGEPFCGLLIRHRNWPTHRTHCLFIAPHATDEAHVLPLRSSEMDAAFLHTVTPKAGPLLPETRAINQQFSQRVG